MILAGGAGSRLGAMTERVPKPMLSVGGRPFLEHLIWNLKRFGINRIILSVGYLAEQFIAHFGTGEYWGVRIEYSIEREALGTGGGVRLAAERGLLDESVLVLNGDTVFDFNHLDLASLLYNSHCAAALALRHVPDMKRYGSVNLQGIHILSLGEKVGIGSGLVNGGVYCLKQAALDLLSAGKSSLEHDLFPSLANRGLLAGKTYDGFFLDIGLPESIVEAQQQIPAWRRKPAVFLDRDGILNVDHGYVHMPSEWVWCEGAVQAVRHLNDLGYLVFVVTNQAGIARGYYDENAFLNLMAWVQQQLRDEGAHFDGVYYCPHHPLEGQSIYRRDCDCRKPGSGLIRQCQSEWELNLQQSVFIGDKESDMQSARAGGVRGLLFPGGNLHEFVTREIVSSHRKVS